MDNILFRNAKDSDLEAIHTLAKESGFGLTTLPKNRTLLAQRLEHATTSWQHIRHTPGNEYYLFVLEDNNTNEVIGTAAIEAKTGVEAPFYSYKLSKRIKALTSRSTENQHEDELLNLVNDHQGHTELCTLYLKPSYRKEHCGAFLSRARFLFMSQYPERFAQTVIAEMRGITTLDGSSPFWDALGYHFFHLSFIEADRLTLSTDKQFIADFMPEYPIYVKLLSPEAQAAIAKPHPSTVPAMELLMNEGFYYNHYIDIFDAGPVLESKISHIKTFKQSQVFILKDTTKQIESPTYLLSNTDTDFRATKGSVTCNIKDNTCILTTQTAALLTLKPGDPVRIAPF
ncbi:MAG: arginine N-succinyltransferase [Gammaproteobacteria bacterium]|nr:arginine N-succinyltransferase [Gammaproteobacteria bacterium]